MASFDIVSKIDIQKLDNAINTATNLFEKLNGHLENRDWLATNHATIADIANYAYIAHAPEGNVDLANYPNIVSWLNRVESLSGFVPMVISKVGLAA